MNNKLVSFFLVCLTVMVNSKICAAECPYAFPTFEYSAVRGVSLNISEVNFKQLSKYKSNPTVAAIIYYHPNVSKRMIDDAKEHIEASYSTVKLSAEIIYRDVNYFKFSENIELARSKKFKTDIKSKWDFANIEVAKFQVANPKSSTPDGLLKAKEILLKNSQKPDEEIIFYLAMNEYLYGNKTIALGGFLTAAAAGFQRSYPFVEDIYKNQPGCEDNYEMSKLIFGELQVSEGIH